MKKLKKIRIGIVVSTVFFGVSAFANTDDAKNTSEKELVETTSVMVEIPVVKKAEVVLKAGKVIEVAYVTIKGGEEQNMNSKYFAHIIPIATKYGGKVLSSFEVTAITGGEVKPVTIILFEWPNIEDHNKLLADKEAQKLFPTRDSMLTYIKLAYFYVENDTKIVFKSNKEYEFFNAWVTPESKTLLPKYFKESEASKQRYGSPKFVADLKPVPNAHADWGDVVLHPHMSGIVEWNKTADYYGLTADPEWKKAAVSLQKSVTRIDMIHAKFNFPKTH